MGTFAVLLAGTSIVLFALCIRDLAALNALPGELDPEAGGSAGDQRRGTGVHSAQLAGLISAFTILPGLAGGSPFGSASTCSMPLSTSPQTVY